MKLEAMRRVMGRRSICESRSFIWYPQRSFSSLSLPSSDSAAVRVSLVFLSSDLRCAEYVSTQDIEGDQFRSKETYYTSKETYYI
jgi:hypothetical protein